MGINKNRNENTTRVSLLISSAILLHLMLTPLAYTTNLETSSGKQYTLFIMSQDAYIINEVNNYELINNIKINSVLGRYLKDFERLLKRVLDSTILPVLTIAILLIYTKTYSVSTYRRKSLLAFSLGGHAPPMYWID